VAAPARMTQIDEPEPLAELRPPQRVLIVDDHPSFRRCARDLLTAEGFSVVGEAEDGNSAVALALELAPELVLLDVRLPDLDGFAVTRQLLARDPKVVIILVSSRERAEYGSLIEESGARGFVSKGDLSGDVIERLIE
jgi:DNA-binding NarL/FixJ family response regulator